MKSWIMQTLFDVRYSYWFIPSVMAIAAIVLAAGLVSIDLYYIGEIPQSLKWLFSSKPEGARAILSTVAGSTITVAGVVFSMTIMSVSHATANYGSRLLLKFLKDRKNQIALGTFTATFIYCLLVLRTVSSADPDAGLSTFVPHVAILGAIALALASVAVLIAFINHVPDTIHIGNVTAERGRELVARLNDMFPRGESVGDEKARLMLGETHEVRVSEAGYIQAMDISGLVKFCSNHSMHVDVLKEPGDFVLAGESIMRFQYFESGDASGLDEKLMGRIVIGGERTPHQDARFLIEELQQIAIRAL